MTARIVFGTGAAFFEPDIRESSRGREQLRITLKAAAEDVAAAFVDGAEYCYEWESEGFDGSGEPAAELYCTDLSEYSIAGEIVDHRDGTVTVVMAKPSEGEKALDALEAADAALREGVNGTESEEGEPRICEAMRTFGRAKAEDLARRAPELSDTELIGQEEFIPEWKAGPQTAGAPVRRDHLDQDYRTLQSHDSTGNPGWTPEAYPALFGVMHTTDPAKAKPWAQPLGTSGMYYKDECYVDATGVTHRQTFDGGNVYDAAAMPSYWETVEV